MSQEILRIQKISGHAGTVPRRGHAARIQSLQTHRHHDVHRLQKRAKWPAWSGTTCRSGKTVFDNTYQTMPETRWNYWKP